MQPILQRCTKRDRNREHFWILCLDSGQNVSHLELLGLGTQRSVQIDPKEVYHLTLLKDACSIVAIHNHPSGRLKPSHTDKGATKKLLAVSQFINIKLLDHLIISEDNYFSFMDEGVFELLNAEAAIMFSSAPVSE